MTRWHIHPIPLAMSVAFMLVTEEGVALVDAGLPGEEGRIWAGMEEHGHRREDLKLVVLTHAHLDHCGCLPALLAGSGAALAAHPLAEERLCGGDVPLPPARGLGGRAMAAAFRLAKPWVSYPDLALDLALEEGSDLAAWGLPATVLHTPGHTADSIALCLEEGVAFVGDLLVGRRGRALPQPYFVEDQRALQRSLARLRACQPRALYVGHSAEPLQPGW